MQTNILDCFEETVCANADKIAVKHKGEGITFAKLKDLAQIFGTVVAKAVKGESNRPIAVFLPKEIHTVIADIAILYSSNPFMNLDVKTPKERIQNILSCIRPLAVITDEKHMGYFDGVEISVISIGQEGWRDAMPDAAYLSERRKRLIDTDPLCIINTSGSTGTPKGVALNHRSFFDFVAVSNELFCFDGTETIGSLSPVVFDIFDFELCMLMCNGSQLVLLDASLAAFPARLLGEVSAHSVSFIFWVPSIMVNIANMRLLEKIMLPSLKLVWFAGEVFPTKQFLYWYDNLPGVKFVNLYGPIEITLDCTFYEVKERPVESEPLPIGIPYRNTDILLLNGQDQRCGIGEEGEICVRGTSLAMGYYNNPEKTAAAFTQNPLNRSYPELIYRTGDMAYVREDGNMIFKGRKDSLIKHMGYRIELGEIEHVVENDLKIVDYCCAVYHYARKEIVLFYENGDEVSDRDFRTALSKVFPSYMLPNVFCRLDALPRNANGKIDRLLLKEKINEDPIEEVEKLVKKA